MVVVRDMGGSLYVRPPEADQQPPAPESARLHVPRAAEAGQRGQLPGRPDRRATSRRLVV